MPSEFQNGGFPDKRAVMAQEIKNKIIDFLSTNPEKTFTLQEMADRLSLSYMTIVRYIADLERAGRVTMKESIENVRGGRPLRRFKIADHTRLD